MRESDKKLHQAMTDLGFPDLAERAAAGEWNDYFGKHAMNITDLILTLRARAEDFPSKYDEIKAVVERAKNGEFDASKAEAEEWAASEEGQETFSALMGGK